MVSPKKQGKENSFEGANDTNVNSQSPTSSPKHKKAKKAKREGVAGVKQVVEAANDNGVVCNPQKIKEDVSLRRSPRKFNISQEVTKKEEVDDDKNNVRRSPKKNNSPQKVTKTDDNVSDNNNGKETKKEKKTKIAKVKPCKFQKDTKIDHSVVDVILPPGSMLTNVAGIDLLPDEAGYALQFLEFCSAFGEVYHEIVFCILDITIFLGAYY